MKKTRALHYQALIAAFALVGCGRGGVPEASVAVARTKQYIDALRKQDIDALARQSVYPFVFLEPAQYPKCKPTEARNPTELPAALACVLTDKLLAPLLSAAPELLIEPASAEMLAALALPAHGPEGTLAVIAYVPGNGVNYHFVTLVSSGGVRALWKFVEFGPD